MYDSIILIKKLPYLPDLLPAGSGSVYNFIVEDFMLRDVKYIWQGISYQALKEVLKQNKQLRSLPLVDNPDNMILLGSVQRFDLIKMIDKHIGRDKRLEVAMAWKKEAEERETQEKMRKMQEERQRRPSRFEVVPAPDIIKLQQIANDVMLPNQAKKENSQFTPVFGTQPKKSILKKTNSFTMKGFSPLSSAHSPMNTPYSTITGAESRLRSAFETIFRKSTTLQDVQNQNDPEIGSKSWGEQSPSIDGQHFPTGHSKKVQLPSVRVCDMSAEDQKVWEMEEMAKPIDLEASHIHIDPSPFQLVERTSLLKVHSLFSMIGINHA